MPRPKKWFLGIGDGENASGGAQRYLVVKTTEGLLKKPYASEPLGRIKDVIHADPDKYSDDSLMIQCENGRIILSLHLHDWTKSLLSERITAINDFIVAVKELMNPSHELVTRNVMETDKENHNQPSQVVSAGIKRQIMAGSSKSPSKKLKYIDHSLDEEIEQHKRGLFEIPISQLVKPPKESRLLRVADDTFVNKLKEKMVKDPAAPGATPMAVLCKDVTTESFNAKYLNVYKYEVLGGLHSLLAKVQLNELHPENPYYKVALAEVYVDLTDEQALRLAQRHNQNSHFVHRVTHRNLIETCRARLYRLAKQQMDSETPAATAEWRESCKRAIIPADISTTHRDAIFYQASLPKRVWDLAIEVMDLFEKARLKDQRLRSTTATAKPDFKQQYLAPIRCLKSEDQCFLLERCKNGHLSLKDIKTEADTLKKMYALKKGFVKLTNSKDWEDSISRYPRFACESQLKKFIGLDISKSFPQPFLDFCKRAKSSEDATSSNEKDIGCMVKLDDFVAFTINAKVSELNGHIISSTYSKFGGADVIFLSIKQGDTREEIENLAYISKEINTVAGLHTYTTIGICNPGHLQTVKEIWSTLFENVDVLFYANTKAFSSDAVMKLNACVSVVLFGFQSTDDMIKKSQFDFTATEEKNNYFEGDYNAFAHYLMDHFCMSGSTVLDLTEDSEATLAIAAFSSGHNVVAVLEDESACSIVFGKLSQLTK